MRTQDEVVHAFTPVTKLSDIQKSALLRLQKAYEDLALEVHSLLPDCPDRTAALRKLLESKFTAVQALTHFETNPNQKRG